MLIESDVWKNFLIEAYKQLNEAIKRSSSKHVEDALQAKIDIIGLLLGKLIQLESKGEKLMPIEYGDLIKKMVSLQELQSTTRRTKLTSTVLRLADAVKKSKEKAAYIDTTKVKYASLYRVVKALLKSGELEKGFFLSKKGEEVGLGYSNEGNS